MGLMQVKLPRAWCQLPHKKLFQLVSKSVKTNKTCVYINALLMEV